MAAMAMLSVSASAFQRIFPGRIDRKPAGSSFLAIPNMRVKRLQAVRVGKFDQGLTTDILMLDDSVVQEGAQPLVSGRLVLLRGAGDGTFMPATRTVLAEPSSYAWCQMDCGDANGDGYLDAVCAWHGIVSGAGSARVCLNNGDGGFTAPTEQIWPAGRYPVDVCLGYLDNVEGLDFALANLGSDNVTCRYNDDGVFIRCATYDGITQPTCLDIAPMNSNDLWNDLVVGCYGGHVAVFINDGRVRGPGSQRCVPPRGRPGRRRPECRPSHGCGRGLPGEQVSRHPAR